jgi:hypothetical protein
MSKALWAAMCLALLLPACATSPVNELTPEGAKIPITEYIQPADRQKLSELNQVTCELGQNAQSREDNVLDCRNKLRNDAAKMGGVLILLEPEKQTMGKDVSNPLLGNMHCPNCVTLRGIVYGVKT